eukprot:scaffold264_cov317-Pinguiococcus_pyrenoidosus.AAC.36
MGRVHHHVLYRVEDIAKIHSLLLVKVKPLLHPLDRRSRGVAQVQQQDRAGHRRLLVHQDPRLDVQVGDRPSQIKANPPQDEKVKNVTPA